MKPKAKISPMPKMSIEQKKEQALRALMQKRASLAEGILFNMVQGNLDADPAKCVKTAIEMADEFIKAAFGQEVTLKEVSHE